VRLPTSDLTVELLVCFLVCRAEHRVIGFVGIERAGDALGHRFLHCSLCSTQWHYVRVKCAHCESTKGISYASLDDGSGRQRKPAVVAEVCDECDHYLKIAYMDRDPQVEPCADDLATLALDLLVADTGKTPLGVNFMLVHGDPTSA